MWRQRLEQGLVNRQKLRVCASRKALTNRVPIEKGVFKIQKLRIHYLTARGDHRKTVEVIKVLRVKCVPDTGIAKGMLMAHNSRCLFFSAIWKSRHQHLGIDRHSSINIVFYTI